MFSQTILIGALGKDPEVRYSTAGLAVASFSLATNKVYFKEGVKHEDTEWHNLVAFGKTADTVQKFLKKGSKVFIKGYNKTDKWEDREGKTHYKTQVVVDEVKFLDWRGKVKEERQPGDEPEQTPASQEPVTDSQGRPIPF